MFVPVKTSYMFENGAWTDGPDLPRELAVHEMVFVSPTEILLIGGTSSILRGGDNSDDCDETDLFNTRTKKWKSRVSDFVKLDNQPI